MRFGARSSALVVAAVLVASAVAAAGCAGPASTSVEGTPEYAALNKVLAAPLQTSLDSSAATGGGNEDESGTSGGSSGTAAGSASGGSQGSSASSPSDSELAAIESELAAIESELNALAISEDQFGDLGALLD